jgi:hypothetical protein
MPESPFNNTDSRARWLLIVVALTALTVVATFEILARRYLAPGGEIAYERGKNVQFLPKHASNVPQPVKDRPELLLVGNSHTYTLPGIKRGDGWRMTEGPVLPDCLAADLAAKHPELNPQHYLLAYPNFLPYEMLVRIGQLFHHGYRPRAVIIGLTYRNIARGVKPREQVLAALEDVQFAGELQATLTSPEIDAPPELRNMLAADIALVKKKREPELAVSIADSWDQELTRRAGEKLVLLGRSADIRGNLTWDYIVPLESYLTGGKMEEITYDVVAADERFNIQCLATLLRWLRQRGISVACYYAPERPSRRFFSDEKPEAQFVADMDALGLELGIPMLDARKLVPEEAWGWSNWGKDASHFHELGHERLAEFIVEELDKQGFWKALAAP